MFNIQENLKNLPDCPGVYLHKDNLGQVIYVGKAISLKNRVRQYFQASKNMDAKVKAMVGHIAEFEYITCGSEMEAFILENNLIKQYRPKYNILLRDDKTYPYIKVTTSEQWPRIAKVRSMAKDGDKYFGPYSDVGAVNMTIELLSNVYKLKKCSAKTFPQGFRPCLNFHIGQCDGICNGKADHDNYMKKIQLTTDYLKGNNRQLTDFLKEKMMAASETLEYEEAQRYRDYMLAAKALSEKQRVVLKGGVDMDVVLKSGKDFVVLFFVRQGKLTGRESYALKVSDCDQGEDRVLAFIRHHYGEQTSGPSEILVESLPEDHNLLEGFLSNLWSKKVKILVPQKGEKKALLDMAIKDVGQMSKTIEDREKIRQSRDRQLALEVHQIISQIDGKPYIEGKEYRLEAYDISNTNGVDTVGAMVVFQGMKKEKKAYRRFKIRTIEGPNDYGSMQEVLYRRFKRAQIGDPGFSTMPDGILIDGGKGHLTAALEVLDAMKIKVPVMGMAKDDSHRTKSLVYLSEGQIVEQNLKETPLLFAFLGNVQEEVHRFAIEYHRGIRDSKSFTSVLDQIPGVGPVKRNALLKAFGTVDKIKSASIDELEQVEGINHGLAVEISNFFIAKNNG